MPRTERIKSKSGYYHVMLRGIDRQTIFFDRKDYDKFRSVFNLYRSKYCIKLQAWCMLPNHVHLLIRDPSDSISTFFRIFGTSFVYWYNAKYRRIGHLFQDRFRSEPIEDPSYLLNAIRYIHMNPVKDKICTHPEAYEYSSYRYYFSSGRYAADDVLFGLITLQDFAEFHLGKNEDRFLDVDDECPIRLTDEDAIQMLRHALGCEDLSQLKTLPQIQQKTILQLLRNRGVSFHQIHRITTIPVFIIQNLLKNK